MKIKGINVFELHVEKIVLGGTLVIAGLLAARQFVTNPNAVEFKRETYSPAKVDAAIQSSVDALEAQLDSQRSLDYSTGESLAGYFKNEQRRPLGSGTTLAHAIVRPTLLEAGDESLIDGAISAYRAFAPAAPMNLRAILRPDTLSDKTKEEHPELASLLPEKEPYDVSVVHLLAEVDGRALHESLLSLEEGVNAIPSDWWERDMAILDVKVERERQLADGEWGELTTVQTIPGQKTVRTAIADADPIDQNDILDLVFNEYQNELYQPKFYLLQDDKEWSTDLVRALEPLTPEEEEAVGRMKYAWSRYSKLLQRAEALANQDNTKAGGRDSQDRRGMGTGEGRAGGSNEADQIRRDRQRASEEKKAAQREKDLLAAEKEFFTKKDAVRALVPTYDLFPDEEAEREAKQREAQLQKARDANQSRNPSFDEGGGPGMGEGGMSTGGEGGRMKGGGGPSEYGARCPGGRRQTGRNRPGTLLPDEESLFKNESLEVWAHDLQVIPGAVYRYRMYIDYHNPFFGRADRLSEEQKPMAKLAYVASAPTEWSDPMRVVATKQFYVTKGTYKPAVEDRRAGIEVYVYTGGSERMLELSIHPGEPIGEIRQVMAKVSGDPLDDENQDQFDRDRDPDVEEADADEKIEIDYSTGAVFLDVIELEPGGKVQVLVALEDGTIVVLDPEGTEGLGRSRLAPRTGDKRRKIVI